MRWPLIWQTDLVWLNHWLLLGSLLICSEKEKARNHPQALRAFFNSLGCSFESFREQDGGIGFGNRVQVNVRQHFFNLWISERTELRWRFYVEAKVEVYPSRKYVLYFLDSPIAVSRWWRSDVCHNRRWNRRPERVKKLFRTDSQLLILQDHFRMKSVHYCTEIFLRVGCWERHLCVWSRKFLCIVLASLILFSFFL